MISLMLAALGGIIFANIVVFGEERRARRRRLEKEERKRLGKKWYDD